MQKTKKVRCIFYKNLRNRSLLNFEWNRFYICQYFKKRSYILYKTLLVLIVYLTTYFFYKTVFLCFRKSGTQCWTFETSISLLVSLSMFRFFYCFNLLQQMFPAGIVVVIFLPCFEKTTKSKKRAHILFLTNVSSLFFLTQKRASK